MIASQPPRRLAPPHVSSKCGALSRRHDRTMLSALPSIREISRQNRQARPTSRMVAQFQVPKCRQGVSTSSRVSGSERIAYCLRSVLPQGRHWERDTVGARACSDAPLTYGRWSGAHCMCALTFCRPKHESQHSVAVPAPAGATVCTKVSTASSRELLNVVHSGAGFFPVTRKMLPVIFAGAGGGTGGVMRG